MLCFKRYLYATVLSSLLILLPLPLQAEWAWKFPYYTDEAPKPASAIVESGASPENRSKPDQKKPVIPATPPSVTPAAASIPSPVLTMAPRALAPFDPSSRFTSHVLTEDTQWNGTVQVEGMVTVAPQATLTIMPGTVVRFGTHSGLLVLGRIVVKGSPEAPILLASQYLEPRPADWYGLVLTGTNKKNLLEHAKIQGAEAAVYARSSSFELKNLRISSSSVAINLVDSIASLRNAVISGFSTGLAAVKSEVDLVSIAFEGGKNGINLKSSSLTGERLKISASSKSAFVAEKSQLKIEKGVFSENLDGAAVTGCEGSFINTRFTSNSGTAVNLAGSPLRFTSNLVSGNRVGIQLEDNLASLWGNSVYGNSNYNILYLGEEKLFLGGNWFGKASGESLNKSLFSRLPDTLRTFPLLADDPLTDSLKDL